MRAALAGVDLLVLEANHDLERLWQGPYPWPLKRRVAGPQGHLSNADAAQLVQDLATGRPPHMIWLAHLSATNNTPALARDAVQAALALVGRAAVPVRVAGRYRPSLSWSSPSSVVSPQLPLPW